MKQVLVLSNDDSILGPMARAVLRHVAGDWFEIVRPRETEAPHPLVLESLREVGIEPELTSAPSRPSFGRDGKRMIIAVSGVDSGVVLSGDRTLNWRVRKRLSANDSIEAFRDLRDQLTKHATSFVRQSMAATHRAG